MGTAVYETDEVRIRRFRLQSHHLDRAYGENDLAAAAGACGLQNSPPGAWETALHVRVPGCGRERMEALLNEEKTLLQAWSFRGVPVVFPAGEEGTFLSSLVPAGEEPWIYTGGIGLALDALGLEFEQVLALVRQASGALDGNTIVSKAALDQFLADRIAPNLPEEAREKWEQPSMYGSPDRQTVGGAAVSFLLRPCSFEGYVVFGKREGNSPTFTSYKNWVGAAFDPDENGGEKLVKKFLRCYGPAGPDQLAQWLGCSGIQARRLWKTAEKEMEPVAVGKKRRYILKEDLERLRNAAAPEREILLLGAHDPYLDQRDRQVILPEKKLWGRLWRTVSNPGAILISGRAAGIWNSRRRGREMEIRMTLWEETGREKELEALAWDYASFWGQELKKVELAQEENR